ncbi:cache domain-containing protein [Ancylobacter sp. VNQ12]|uniref:cache domain-containing protein n=1 Tax=Ancylobacter sp. VNQ12 TaxID=3400920 RepID=UPI003BFD964C
MSRAVMLAISLFSMLLLSNGLSAQQYGTAQQARAMLEHAITAVKADRSDALAAFNKGADGFREGDLYVFCTGLDGTTLAHANPAMLGQNINDLKDSAGKAFGKEIMSSAREGQITTVSYTFPRPGESQPVAKESYITKIGGLVCGVGYYK